MDFVVPAPKFGEFIARMFHNGLALGRKLLSVNQFMLLGVSLATRQTAALRKLKVSQTLVIFKVYFYCLPTLHCRSRNENRKKNRGLDYWLRNGFLLFHTFYLKIENLALVNEALIV